MKPSILFLLLLFCKMPAAFAQPLTADGPQKFSAIYIGIGGGKDILNTRSAVYGVSLIGYNRSLWGAEFHYRRAGFTALNLPKDYIFGSGGQTINLYGAKKPEPKMKDYVNLWELGLVKKWHVGTGNSHLGVSGGFALTDYYENEFTYTGVQSGGAFAGKSANYSAEIRRNLLPGGYLRTSYEMAIDRGLSMDFALWGSFSSKVQTAGIEGLLNFGLMRSPRRERVKAPRPTPRPAWRKPVPENG